MPLADMLDWSVALIPVLVLVGVFVWLDVFKLMTLWETLGLLLLGGLTGLAAYPLSGVFLDALPLGFSTYSRFAAPWVEEAVKALAVVGLFVFNRIGFKLDAVISGFAIGAGFSVVENIIYLLRFPDLVPTVWLVRGVGTAVMHGTTLAIFAAFAHEFAERDTRAAAADYRFNALWFAPGFIVAVAIHSLFNQFPDQPLLAMTGTIVAAPLMLLAIFRFGAGEAEQWLMAERADHRAALAALKAGAFPDTPSGRKIAALAARSGPAAAAAIRDYCVVLTELALAAEDALHRQASDEDRVRVEGRAAFARAGELKRALGRATFAALKPLLPFSRNDYWEISELKERLTRASR